MPRSTGKSIFPDDTLGDVYPELNEGQIFRVKRRPPGARFLLFESLPVALEWVIKNYEGGGGVGPFSNFCDKLGAPPDVQLGWRS